MDNRESSETQETQAQAEALTIEALLAPAYQTVENQLRLVELDVKRFINQMTALREQIDASPQYAIGKAGQIATQILNAIQKMGAIQQTSAELIANMEAEGRRLIESHQAVCKAPANQEEAV
jgi:ABC-type glycerol-3-phosphate transport system substrate-binding protein